MLRHSRCLARLGRKDGQVVGFTVVMAVAMIAMGAFVVDVGSWIWAHRATQSVADASALAAAQKLPRSPSEATQLAQEYSDKNGGGLSNIQFESNTFTNDTVSVKADRTSPGFLSKVLGISSVNVSASAKARAYNLGSARFVGPFAVDEQHPFIRGNSQCPCLGENYVTTVDLDTGRPSLGAFKIINIDGTYGGLGQSTLSEWITEGYDGYMGTGWYYSNPGAKFNPSEVAAAVNARAGSEILIPVYSSVREQGAGYEYRVIGWIGFYVISYVARGAGGAITGYFTSVTWDGIASESGSNFFGATVVKLVA